MARDLLKLVRKCNVAPYPYEPEEYNNFVSTTYRLLTHDGAQEIGRMVPFVVLQFKKHLKITLGFIIDDDERTVQFGSHLDTFGSRSQYLVSVAEYFREVPEFTSLKGWRDELYVCYYPSKTPYFVTERAFAPYLGILMFGVHVNGYVPPEKSKDGKLKLWIARRSPTKQTWPNYLDNAIAGGIAYPHGIYETFVKESMEEANISKEYVESHSKSVGVLTYVYAEKDMDEKKFIYTESVDEEALVYGECEFIYDLEFSEIDGISPKVNDNEVSGFQLWDMDKVLEALHNGEFKPNCALVTIDFLIRLGYFTPENTPDYTKIVQYLHRDLGYPTMV